MKTENNKEIIKEVNTDLYIIVIYEDNSVAVFERFRNTKQGLREIVEAIGSEKINKNVVKSSSPYWTVSDFGLKLLEALDDKNITTDGQYYLSHPMFFGTVIAGKKYNGSTKEGLRKIAEKYKIPYENSWNTQQFGRKIVEYLK
jgi:hypothetical protein